jgi:hypothetical protein
MKRTSQQREARLAMLALDAEVKRDQFLPEWLAASSREVEALHIETRTLNAAERAAAAAVRGFRTWHQLLAYADDMQRAQHVFVHEEAFQRLWNILKRQDALDGAVHLYGPHNGGVPASLLGGIERWHLTPKFTASQRRRVASEIRQTCDALLLLLGQVSPGSIDESRLGGLAPSADQVRQLLQYVGVKETLKKRAGESEFTATSLGRMALARVGITPAWAIESLRAGAEEWARNTSGLPTKVNAKGAKKSFFIAHLDEVLFFPFSAPSAESLVGNQLRADLISLLANTDCTADDVRKANEQRRHRLALKHAEDYAALARGNVPSGISEVR